MYVCVVAFVCHLLESAIIWAQAFEISHCTIDCALLIWQIVTAMDSPFVSGTPAGSSVTIKKSTLALLGIALLATGGLAMLAMSGSNIDKEASLVLTAQKGDPVPATTLLMMYGQNATILEPNKLYYINCLACYTCGRLWRYKVAELNRGGYQEFAAGCNRPDHWTSNDNPYVCCAR